jgi:hypothetical protein
LACLDKTMIFAYTISIVTFLIAVAVLWNKKAELYGEGPIFNIGNDKIDQKVYDATEMSIYFVTHLSVQKSKYLCKKTVIYLEGLVIKLMRLVSERFSFVGDMVTGKSIPKNKGSVSFFLKNVESVKKISSVAKKHNSDNILHIN